jgi:hypothetical protein
MDVLYYYNPKAPEHAKKLANARAERERKIRRPKPSLASRVASYLRAEFGHAISGAAHALEVRKRISACMKCPKRATTYQGKVDDGGIGFCTACGCPASRRSQLSVKLTMAGVVCPLGKFQKAKGTGGTISGAVEAARGVVSTAVQMVQNRQKNNDKQQHEERKQQQ